MPALIDGRLCALLTAAGVVLFALRMRPKPARCAWSLLLVLGIAHAVVSSTSDANLVNINVVHHYLGAKHAVPYAGFYRAVDAALERPQVDLRDLEHPPAMLRADPREQRAYFIELLRGLGVEFDATAPTDVLRQRALESGAVAREAAAILGELVGSERADSFRDDVRAAVAELHWQRDITSDYGFNGSPFYALVRRLDPTLHRPFSRATALLNVVWQVAGMLAAVWIAGAALELDFEQRIAAAALLFASWDFVGYAVPGLVCVGLWLPVSIALFAVRRRAFGSAGVAIAWAGAIKLFPFVLLLPFVVRIVRALVLRRGIDRDALRLVSACAVATAVFACAALFSGRSWGDFAQKIGAQFASQAVLANSVSFAQELLALGGHSAASPVPRYVALAVAALAIAMFAGPDDEDASRALPRRMLVVVGLGPWLATTWLNYYALAPLLLLPLHAPARRVGAVACALAMCAAFALPDFDDPRLLEQPALHALKVAPYLLVSGWMLAIELAPRLGSRRSKRIAAVAAAAGALVLIAETSRLRAIRRYDELGSQCLDRGDAAAAVEHFEALVALAPGNATARMNRAIALAGAGREREAAASFARAAQLDPENAVARQNYGRWLLRERQLGSSLVELEAARALAPFDETILFDLARTHLERGDRVQAAALLRRARELAPEDASVTQLLRQI